MPEKKPKVVHISTVHSWQDPRIYYKQCASLANQGFEIHLITPDAPNETVNQVRLHSLRYSPSGRFSRLLFAGKHIFEQALKLNPDIIHFHDPELIPSALRVQKRFIGSIIYDVHEDNTTAIAHREYLNDIIRPCLIKLVSYYEKKASKELNTIIAEKYYSRRFPKAQAILNYPKLDWMTEKLSDKIYEGLIYTGNVREERGALIHAKILQNIRNVEVWHIGRCEPSLFEKMKYFTGDNKDRLIVKGVSQYVPFDEIVSLYNSRNWLAGLAIFPYSEHVAEKQLTKFFEYMAAGIPIIYSDFPAWRNLLEPLNVGIAVNPESEEDIISAVLKLKSNSELQQSMGRNGQKYVKMKFSWEIEEKKLVRFYESLLQN